MTSGFAKVFVFAAIVYALFTAGELWINVEMILSLHDSARSKTAQLTSAFVGWLIDPVFLCGTAVMIEFLERIWRELVSANAGRRSES